jgi:hypothetical protein
MSHITPKFLWKGSGLTGNGKSFEAPCLTNRQLSRPHLQDGFKEQLLCRDCENRLSLYESYAKTKLSELCSTFNDTKSRVYIFSNIDYAKMKLFFMSVLFRMGVSRLLYYQNVKLGAHEARLRQMLLINDPGAPFLHGCSLCLLNYNGIPLTSMFSQPVYNKLHNSYECIIAGIYWRMFVSTTMSTAAWLPFFLSDSGEWVIMKREIRFFRELSPLLHELLTRDIE